MARSFGAGRLVAEEDPLLRAAEMLDPTPDPYFYDPVAWVHDMFDWGRVGKQPTEYQDEVLGAIPVHKRVSVRGPHGLGKTALASWAVLWFAMTREKAGVDWKIPTTASAWRQLEKYLWPEIHKWSRLLRFDRLDRRAFDPKSELLALNLKLRFGQASALASDNPTAIEGAHADHLFYLMDEAKAIMPGIFEAVEGAFSGAGGDTDALAYALCISTPGEPNGYFYDIHARKPGTEEWWARHVTLEETVRAGRVSREWAEARRKQWGENSAVYKNRVLGEFSTEDVLGIIPLAWVEQANERWRAHDERGWDDLPRFTSVGCDVAASGSDRTVLALRHIRIIREIRTCLFTTDTMEIAGLVGGVLDARRLSNQEAYAAVDGIGIGAGVVDRLRERGYDVFAFIASGKSNQVDMSEELGFVNMRAAAWWTMRELLDPAYGFNVELPPEDRLIGDLCAPHWKVTSGAKIQVESKDDIRKRLGRSTDYADAVVMAFALRPDPDPTGSLIIYDQPVTISPY